MEWKGVRHVMTAEARRDANNSISGVTSIRIHSVKLGYYIYTIRGMLSRERTEVTMISQNA